LSTVNRENGGTHATHHTGIRLSCLRSHLLRHRPTELPHTGHLCTDDTSTHCSIPSLQPASHPQAMHKKFPRSVIKPREQVLVSTSYVPYKIYICEYCISQLQNTIYCCQY